MVKVKKEVKIALVRDTISPIKIPQDVQLKVVYAESEGVFPLSRQYPPNKTIVISLIEGNLKVISLDDCRLVVVDGGREVVFD